MKKAKMDGYLTEVLEKVNPEEELYIIVGFYKTPSDKQLELLVSDGMEIIHDYRGFMDAIAGKLPAKLIDKIRQYHFIEDLELSGGARL